ncbi:MAG: aldo/keto reductase family protein [Armatimonadetes bacterium]|nr:aldo/keto reductase family protein [Armatimonadota bacterium]
MKYRQLGSSGLRVSEVALGGWLTQGRTIDDATTESIVRRAFELGVTSFDTADVYNSGEAELALGKAVKSLKREDIVVATKCYFPMSDNPNDRGLGRKHVIESVHASLRRLQMDYVDVFQYHRYDESVPMEEMVRSMDDMARQGKILYWGVSEWPVSRIVEACHVAEQLGCHPPVSNQPQYNMLNRYIEPEILPACVRYGMGQVVFSPLAQGVLTGKYKPGEAAPKGSRGADDSSNQFMQGWMGDETLARVQSLADLAKRLGCTIGQFALAWCLRQPGVSSVIVGATNTEQIEQNAAASELDVPESAWADADRILGVEP